MSKRFLRIHPRIVLSFAGVVACVFLAGCRPLAAPEPPPLAEARATIEDLGRYQAQPVGAPVDGHPWIAHVAAIDLDRDGLMDVLVCDAQKNQVAWIRQSTRGQFEEIILADGIPAPVHAEAVDLDGDGDLDVLVASMGAIFPNNDRIGSILVLENDGHQRFAKRVVAEHVARVTDVRAGDFNGDGKLDLAVAQFGYDQGEICWMENLGNWQFKHHPLLNLSGTINVCVADMNGDRTPDIVAVVSQEWEEIHLFANDGAGNFTDKVLWGSTNEDFASSGISLCDLNRDGRPDILYTNGDGFGPSPQPGPRPWHGVQWLENRGGGLFKFHRIADLPGAYSPVGADIDGDGATDVVALSGFNDWTKPQAVSLVWFRNDGRQNFTPYVLAYKPTHLVSVAVGDFDGNGRPALVTGNFYSYPPYIEPLSRVIVWHPVLTP
jgi:hypothetical protein